MLLQSTVILLCMTILCNKIYSLRRLLLSPAMRSAQEWLNRPRDVDLRFRANIRPQIFGWLVGWLVGRIYKVNCGRRGAGSAHNRNVTTARLVFPEVPCKKIQRLLLLADGRTACRRGDNISALPCSVWQHKTL